LIRETGKDHVSTALRTKNVHSLVGILTCLSLAILAARAREVLELEVVDLVNDDAEDSETVAWSGGVLLTSNSSAVSIEVPALTCGQSQKLRSRRNKGIGRRTSSSGSFCSSAGRVWSTPGDFLSEGLSLALL
jgi:hypothetical protein